MPTHALASSCRDRPTEVLDLGSVAVGPSPANDRGGEEEGEAGEARLSARGAPAGVTGGVMKVAPIGNHESAGFADGCCTV
jgi:hypothetical protein